MMNKINVIKILKFLFFVFIVAIAHMSGIFYGTLQGLDGGLKYKNSSLVEAANETNEEYYMENEYLVIDKNRFFNMKLECSYGKFKFKSDEENNFMDEIVILFQKILNYPALHCW